MSFGSCLLHLLTLPKLAPSVDPRCDSRADGDLSLTVAGLSKVLSRSLSFGEN
jgi:hypothetical protein